MGWQNMNWEEIKGRNIAYLRLRKLWKVMISHFLKEPDFKNATSQLLAVPKRGIIGRLPSVVTALDKGCGYRRLPVLKTMKYWINMTIYFLIRPRVYIEKYMLIRKKYWRCRCDKNNVLNYKKISWRLNKLQNIAMCAPGI